MEIKEKENAMMIEKSKHRLAIEEAYRRGYRVTQAGILISPSGKQRIIKKVGKQEYPTFTIRISSGFYGIGCHKFAAFCFYGEQVWQKGIVVRHLNGMTEDISKNNILLGTHSENNLDKPKEVRVNAARIARLSQGKTPTNAKLNLQTRLLIKERALNERIINLAKEYNVHYSTIYKFLKGKTYND